MMRTVLLLTAGTILQSHAASLSAAPGGATCVTPPRITTVPAVPVTGTLFELRIVDTTRTAGYIVRVAGEPIHFRMRSDTLVALAAMPVDSTAGVLLAVACSHLHPDSIVHREVVAASSGNYRLEKLTVAPRFGTPPDSALAARMRGEAARAAAVSRAAHDTPQLWDAAFVVPRNSRITSGFGNGRTFNGEVTSRHTGSDFSGAVGAPVNAINRGVVRIVGAFYLGGNVVYIDHGAGLVSAYLHLSRQLVAEGDTVARGQVIGRVGATGRVTGPHLHLITRFGQVSVNAMSLIGRQ